MSCKNISWLVEISWYSLEHNFLKLILLVLYFANPVEDIKIEGFGIDQLIL